MEEKWTYGTTNRVCVKSDADAQFSSVVSAIRNQHQDGLQVEGAFWRKGLAGMEEESRRPKSHSKQLAEEEVCEIVRLKLAHLAWGPRKIRELYLRGHGEVASESTFKRVLERTSLTQKRRRRRAPEAGRLSSGRQAAALNEVWTVDFKGWWRKAEQRCEPLTVRDEYSRYLLEVRAVEDAGAKRCAKVLSRSLSVTACPKQSAAITARPLPVGRECLA